MRRNRKTSLSVLALFGLFLLVSQLAAVGAFAQTDLSSVPRLVKYTGTAPAGSTSVTFAIYATEDGLAPLWLETQNVTADETGHYTVLLGATKSDGLPASIFASGEARWIGVKSGDSPESARTLLVSVPYALKAGDAETLGGKPLSAFVMADAKSSRVADKSGKSGASTSEISRMNPELNGTGDTGTLNFIAKFSGNGADAPEIASAIFESGGLVGIGTTSPTDALHVNGAVRFGAGTFVPGQAKMFVSAQHGSLFTANTGSTNDLALVSASGNLLLTNPTGTNNLVMLSGGSFGVNTSNVTERLTVNGGIKFGPSSFSAGSPTLYVDSAHGTTLTGSTGSVNDLALVSSVGNLLLTNPHNTNNLVFFSGGNFGLNTFSPGDLLHVNGAIRFGSSGFVAGVGRLYTSAQNGTLLTGNTGSATDLALVSTGGNLLLSNPTGTNNLVILSGGNFGVNTGTPTSKLHVVGSVTDQVAMVSNTAAGAGTFTIGTPPPSAVHGDTTATSGFITGILGTASTVDGFGILGENLASGVGSGNSAGIRGITANTSSLGTGVWGDALQTTGDNIGVFGRSASNAGTGVFGQSTSATGDTNGVYGTAASNGGTGIFGEVTANNAASQTLFPAGVYGKAANAGAAGLFDVSASPANILIGRQGTTNVFRVDNTGKGFFNGGTQTNGADFAESVTVLDERSSYEPGDVIAIDTTGIRRFAKSAQPYSTLVAGIYSTKPGVLATKHMMDDPRLTSEEIPLAVVGIVPCKVTNENGEINAGDLLVSSSTGGYAMKGTDRSKMTGAVVGKALQAMHAKSGVIEVLVSLQ